ncbi:MAG: DUF3817 domain-containing protein [Hyphomicrobiaceae bacterium]|nr:DUF3817 domain-containing protein [Hyphomicrobiaceae bacterium]
MTAEMPSDQRRGLRLASRFEAVTLLTLFFIAMPLKYWLGFPIAVSIAGTIHGIAFLLFAWMLFNAFGYGGLRVGESLKMMAFAFVPFGGFFNDRHLSRRLKDKGKG